MNRTILIFTINITRIVVKIYDFIVARRLKYGTFDEKVLSYIMQISNLKFKSTGNINLI